MSVRRQLLGALLALAAGQADAHPLAPALLQLDQRAPDRFELTWRTPVRQVRGAEVRPELPANCIQVGEGQSQIENNEALVERWAVRCEGGLAGRAIAVSNLAASGINVIVRIASGGGVTSALLDARQPAFVVPLQPEAPAVFVSYMSLGLGHLLTGLDHMLFLLGLVLLVRELRPLVVTVTAFTAGHSATLALATLGLVRINPALTEFGIALSIVTVACALADSRGTQTLLSRRPWAMAGAFGLLHGLGFAGALSAAGLPAGEVPLALLGFNLGIEAGQLLLIGAALLLAAAWRGAGASVPARGVLVYSMGAIAASWCFERSFVLVGWN